MGSRRDALFDPALQARLEKLALLARRVAAGRRRGMRPSRRIGDGLEFADHRDYSPGDDVRFVDWPYFARMEKLLLRLFHEHSDRHVAILLDVSGSMGPAGPDDPKFVYALRTAAAMACVAAAGRDRLSVQPFADRLGPALSLDRGLAGWTEVLDFLAGLEPEGPTRLAGPIRRWADRRREPTACVLISDLLETGAQLVAALSALRARRSPVAVIHLQAREDADPELSGPVELRAAESGASLRIQPGPDLLAAYRAAWSDWTARLASQARAAGAELVAAPTGRPFEQLVLDTLVRAGIVDS
jgi:uncharacterized protein (DUF58 family)